VPELLLLTLVGDQNMKKEKENSIKTENQKLLLSATDCARMCGISSRSWFRYVASGKTPACIRLNNNPKWNRKVIELWISMGCPDRTSFEALLQKEGAV
jgi:predicted DNA-binding transcriptional regulator AlpA